jgi:hypothetical protein
MVPSTLAAHFSKSVRSGAPPIVQDVGFTDVGHPP